MSPPIRDGSGSSIGSIRLGDGSEISEVRTGAGDVLFSAIPDSLVSRWEFDDPSDTSTAIDSAGTEDGTINGATYTTDAEIGSNALDFGNGQNFVGPFTNSVYSFESNFSLACWVKPNTTKKRNPVMNKGESRNDESNKDYYLSLGDGNIFADVANSTNSADNLKGSSVPTGSYTHIGMTYDGSELVIYKNGSVDNTASIAVTVSSSFDLNIGKSRNSGGTERFFDGIIDDPRVYDKPLSDTEFNNLFNTGSING